MKCGGIYQHSGKLRQEDFHFEARLGYIVRQISKKQGWGGSSAVECFCSMKRKEKERTLLEASFRNPKAVVPESWVFCLLIHEFINPLDKYS